MGPSYYFPPVTQTTQSTHDLNTLADFADTLDALPLELTRGFSDLRELDAVLSCMSLPNPFRGPASERISLVA